MAMMLTEVTTCFLWYCEAVNGELSLVGVGESAMGRDVWKAWALLVDIARATAAIAVDSVGDFTMVLWLML